MEGKGGFMICFLDKTIKKHWNKIASFLCTSHSCSPLQITGKGDYSLCKCNWKNGNNKKVTEITKQKKHTHTKFLKSHQTIIMMYLL